MRDNARWHEPDRVAVADPERVQEALQSARDALAQAMALLDGDDSDDPNEAQEDVLSAVTWIDHAALVVRDVKLEADGGGDLPAPDDHPWSSGYVEV